jgi:hypothetical protein
MSILKGALPVQGAPILAYRVTIAIRVACQLFLLFDRPILEKVLNDGGIGQRRGVAEIGQIVGRDLA